METVPRRLFFASRQSIGITWSPNYYKKMQRSTTRRNQKEYGPDVKWVWRNHQKTIAVVKMSQTKPHASVPPPPCQVNWRVFLAGFPRGDPESAEFTRHSEPPLLGERAGWSAVWYISIALRVFRKIQSEDGQWCAAPFLFGQDLPNSYWWARASFGVFI